METFSVFHNTFFIEQPCPAALECGFLEKFSEISFFGKTIVSLKWQTFPICWTVQKQPPEVFYNKDVLKNFAKVTRKHLLRSLFLNKAASWNFIKKAVQHSCFSVIFAKYLKTPALKNTSSGFIWQSWVVII